MEHINTMSHLREGIHLRSYAQNNPLREYKNEGYVLFDELLSKEAIQNAFIADFNSTTNSNIQSLDELISKRYTYMKNIGQFFANNSMRSKWYYLLDLLEDENSALGLQIQLERIKENGSGDLEYVTKALGYLLKGESALEDSEVKVDFSKEEVQSKLTSQFGTYSVTYEKEAYL